MEVAVSTRISIRWPPADASEPTDTLVISVGDYYVDLRVLKLDQSIDWAMAGQRLLISENPVKIKFTHPLDSHYAPGQEEGEPDIGEFSKLPNGDDLETGVMAAPHMGGKPMAYEEIWRDVQFSLSSGTRGWILESVDDTSDEPSGKTIKSYYGRAGKFFLALRQTRTKVPLTLKTSALRQDLSEADGSWNIKYSIGDVDGMFKMSSGGDVDGAWKTGDKVTVGPQSELCIVRAMGP